MRRWLLTCSIDGVNIDYEAILESPEEPDFWTCYNLAEDHGCSFWSLDRWEV